jgi:3-methyladenine DNA glycosylase/8-oxoguanine DNA glycosylase
MTTLLAPADRAPADPHAEAVRHLGAADARLAALIARVGPCRLGAQTSGPFHITGHFEGLVEAIVSQQLSPKAAETIYGRVRALALGDDGRLVPARLLALPDERLREAGLSGAKTRSIRDLSEHVARGVIALDRLDALADDEVIATLTQVKGIGRWTAEMFLMFRLARPDVLPVGDLGIQKGFVRLFNLRKMPTAERMEKLARPFRPYRSIACWYLWRLLEEKPAR